MLGGSLLVGGSDAPVLTYDATIGALLLCSWFNCSLFTVEGLQVYEYFARFRHDSLLNKMFVVGACISDTAGMTANMSAVYLYSITHFGDALYAQSQPWAIPLYVVSSGVSAAITQSFLSLRIYRLTSQVVYLVVFFLLTAASLGGAIGTAIGVIAASSLEDRNKLQTTVRIWLSCAAAVDLLIALALVRILAGTRSDFKETGHVLRRLMYASVKTGSITAGFAILSLLFYTIQPNDNISVFFSLSLGRLYSISMLANLNARHSNDGTSRGPSSGDATSSHGRSEGRSGKSRTSKTKGIKITSETVTRVDDNTDLDLEEQGDAIQLSARRKTEKAFGDMVPINESSMNVVSYEQSPTPKDAWDAESVDQLDHSQVDLVKQHSGRR